MSWASWAVALALAAAPSSSGKDVLRDITVGGRPRVYSAHVPAAAERKRPIPAVINLHGLGSNAAEQAALTRMNLSADREGYLVLYPEGTGAGQSFNAGSCCGEALRLGLDDVAYIRALLDDASATFSIDPKRIYATGMSNGALMAQRLACELSDRIAAIAPVAGVLGVPQCHPKRPVSVLEFHGTLDTLVLYGGGGFAQLPSVEEVVKGWADRDGCKGKREVFLHEGAVTCERYGQCPRGVDVELCRVEGGGHTWPGGASVPRLGNTTADVSATDMMWGFFREHSR